MHYPSMNDELRRAATAMAEARYVEALELYRAICQQYPAHAAIAASQVGAAYFFLQRFALAIQWYEYSGQLGCDPQMVRDNLVEANEALQNYRPRLGDVVLTDTGELLEFAADGSWQPHRR